MNASNAPRDITILLLVKGRDIHTLRWMWHANKIGLRYPIVIADGGDNPISRRVLADRGNFPKLDYKYCQYNDTTILDYYEKVADAAGHVTTPYVFRADNDDFILPSGLERALEHLRADKNLVWSGANLGIFSIVPDTSLRPPLVGQLYRQVLELRRDAYAGDRAMQRLANFLSTMDLQVYYAVFRIDNFRRIYNVTVKNNFINLDQSDLLKSTMSLLAGPHMVDEGSVIYMHQTDTSEFHSAQKDLAHKIACKGYMDAFASIIASAQDFFSTPEEKTEVENLFRTYLETTLRRLFLQAPPPAASRRFSWLKQYPLFQKARLALDKHNMKACLKARSAQPHHLTNLMRDMDDVRNTLEDGEFLRFLGRVCPEALG